MNMKPHVVLYMSVIHWQRQAAMQVLACSSVCLCLDMLLLTSLSSLLTHPRPCPSLASTGPKRL